jgi:hypothetical protein
MNAQSSTMARLLTVFILLACVMLDGGAYAQTAKRAVAAPKVKKYATAGVLEVGGSASFSMSTQVNANTTSPKSTMTLEATPYIGYFVIDGLVLGFRPLGASYTSLDTGGTIIKINTFFAPGYVFDLRNNFYPYVEGLVGYTSESIEYAGTTKTFAGISYGGDVGVKMMLPNRGLLNFSVQYLMITMNPSGATKRSGENVLSAELGYSIWF